MFIQHNITAMCANRNYRGNIGALNKNLEKLSSGYRINRAGDDAAGLAISEEMRARITGLSAAEKNVADGINLIKVAEGAMQEIHSMLNRMHTLAVQSANGVYRDELDRQNIEAETEMLKQEIDRIAEATNFNEVPLLDGSLYGGANGTGGAGGAQGAGGTGGTSGTSGTQARKTSFSVDLGGVALPTLAGEKIAVTLGSNAREEIEVSQLNNLQGNTLAEKLVAHFSQKWPSPTVGGQAFTLSASGNTLKLEQNAVPTTDSEVVAANCDFKLEVLTFDPARVDGTAKTNAAFGDKAKLGWPNGNEVYIAGGKAYVGDLHLHEDAIVDWMRMNGIQGDDGKTSGHLQDVFTVSYDPNDKLFYLKLSARDTIGEGARSKVVNAAGQEVLGGTGFAKKGETMIISFGELGELKLSAEQTDFSENYFIINALTDFVVVEKANSINGGSVNCSGLDKTQLAKAVEAAGVSGTGLSITMQRESDRFVLMCGNQRIAETDPCGIGDTTLSFHSTADPNISVGNVVVTPVHGATINGDSYSDAVETDLKFRARGNVLQSSEKISEFTGKVTGSAGTSGTPGTPGTGGSGTGTTPTDPDTSKNVRGGVQIAA